MNRIKLKIVVIPSQFADIPTDSLASFNSRKFLHLTDPETSLEKVCGELTRRFKRLYPFEEDLLIENLQDDDKCDLDAEFKVSDVLGPGETLRVVIGNDLNPNRANANRSYMSTILNSNATPSQAKVMTLHHPSQSTPLMAAPALIQENASPISNRTITQRYFETSDQNIPIKLPNHTNNSKSFDENYSGNYPRVSSVSLTMKRIRPSTKADSSKSKLSLDNDDSHVSFPPPDQVEDRTIPQKRELSKPSEYPLPGKRRITSGMLAMPPHAQLEKERIEQEVNSSQHNATSMKNISLESSSEDGDSSVVLPPASENLNNEEPQADTEHYNENSPKEEQSTIEESKKETLSKSEIIKLFKNGMKIPSSIRNRFASKNGRVDMNEIQKNAIIRNLEIDMVDGNIIPVGEERATRGHSKKIKGNTKMLSSPPYKELQAQQDASSKSSPENCVKAHQYDSGLLDVAIPANPESVIINKDNDQSQESAQRPNNKPLFATNINNKSTSENLQEILGEFEELDSRLKSYKKHSYDNQMGKPSNKPEIRESKITATSNNSNGRLSDTKSTKITGETILRDMEVESVEEHVKSSKDKNRTQELSPLSLPPSKIKIIKNHKEVKDKEDAETAQKLLSAPQVSKKESNTHNSASTPIKVSTKDSKNSDSSDNSSSSEDDNSEDEQKENKKPRLADDVHSVSQKGSGISFKRKIDKPKSRIGYNSKETPKDKPMEADKSTVIDKVPGTQSTEQKKEVSIASSRKKSYSNEIKKPILTSLKDLALRGVPDVESNRKKLHPLSKAMDQKAVTVSNSAVESSSESDSGDESSSDDSSDSSNSSSSSSDEESDKETSEKFIDAKKFKRKKKARGGFLALMKDAKKL